MIDQNYQDTAHLLRRAGFGASPDAIRAAAATGLEAVSQSLLDGSATADSLKDDDFLDRLAALAPENATGRLPVQAVKILWIRRMLFGPNPLVEKMTLFWHGHFTSKLGGDGSDMLAQNRILRQHALGNFRTLTLAISRDPAMLKYLNGNQNFKAHPNENYARELMELFTCGIGNYTENDVKAAARAFTGWNLRMDEFDFNQRQHDDGPKTFLGKTGNWNGNDIVDMLVAHPATARRVCSQLFMYFVHPDPTDADLAPLIATYYNNGYDIKAVMGQMLRSPVFYADESRNSIIKCPAQFVVGTIKMLGLEDAFNPSVDDVATEAAETEQGFGRRLKTFKGARDPKLARLASLPVAMRSMGQDLLAPPSVKGWDGGEAWINSSTLMNRVAFGERLAQSPALYRELARRVVSQSANAGNADAWVSYLSEALGPLDLGPTVRDTMVAYASQPGSNLTASLTTLSPAQDGARRRPNRDQVSRYLGLLPLIMGSPEYQVC